MQAGPDGQHCVVRSFDGNDQPVTIQRRLVPPGQSLDTHPGTFTSGVGVVYDGRNRVARRVDLTADPNTQPFAGPETAFEYDCDSNVKRISNLCGLSTTNEFDANDRLVLTTDPHGAIARYKYDDNDNATQVIVNNPSGGGESAARINAFNARNELVSSVDVFGKGDSYHYDDCGRLDERVDARGCRTTFVWDKEHRLLSTTRHDPINAANNIVTGFEYDESGNRTAVIDPKGRFYRFEYDCLDRVTRMVYPPIGTDPPHEERYAYDRYGNLRIRIDANGKVAKYFHDHLNRPFREEHFVSGSLVKAIDRTYDLSGNLKSIDDGSTKQVYAYTYFDPVTGQPVDDSPQPRNFVKQVDWHLGGALFRSVSYKYDNCGRRTEMKEPRQDATIDGATVRYNYTPGGLLTGITRQQPGDGSPDGLVRSFVAFSYDPGGRMTAKTFGNGVAARVQRDLKGRVTQMASVRPDGTALSKFDYEYDAADNRTKTVLGHANASFTYGYDCFNRLTSEVCSGSSPPTSPVENLFTAQAGGNEAPLGGAAEVGAMPGMALPLTIAAYTASYTYDPAGNRLTKTDSRPGQGTFSYSYDEENRLTLEAADHPDPTPDEQIDFGYDKNGNMTRQTVKEWNGAAFVQVREDTYAYDYADRLNVFTRTALPSPTTFAYGYAPTGDRVTKTQTGGNTQTFIYDGRDVIADYNAPPLGQTGFVKAYLGTLGIDSKICEISPAGSPTYYNTDILGSVHQLLNQPQVGQQPEVVAGSTQLTTAWGESILTGGGMTRYGFTQRERDDESDLQYNRARHYSPRLGRFIQRDGRDPVLDHYVYGFNSPLGGRDPAGESFLSALFGFGSEGSAADAFDATFGVEVGARAEMGAAITTGAVKGLGEGVTNVGEAVGDVVVGLGTAIWNPIDTVSGIQSSAIEAGAAFGREGFTGVVVGVGQGIVAEAEKDLSKFGAFIGVNAAVALIPIPKVPPGVATAIEKVPGARAVIAAAKAAAETKIDPLAEGAAAGAGRVAPRGGPFVYRGLAEGENPAVGLTARAPGVKTSPASHVAGKRASEWISTTKSEAIAREQFGQHGTVRIDLSKVAEEVLDLSRGIPGLPENSMLSNWARKFQEVLIRNRVPAEAVKPP